MEYNGIKLDECPIYLDNNATTPLDPEVIEEIQSSLNRDWANPSSSYDRGSLVRSEILKARRSVSKMIGGPLASDEFVNASITFTSGGTESNHLVIHSAIKHFWKSNQERFPNKSNVKPHVVTTNVEHVAIEKPLKTFEADGLIDVTFVEVENGKASIQGILEAVRPNTCLVSVMLANNETGIINPVGDIMKEIQALNRCRILTHSDAAQAIGKVPVDVKDLHVDFLTIVGHKFYGPRIGALYHEPGLITPFLEGGGQEFGRRAGTENTPMILGLGKACEIVFEDSPSGLLDDLRSRLEKGLTSALGKEGVHINFEGTHPRLPNTSSLAFPRVSSGKDFLDRLQGLVDASTSAACHSASSKGSQVLVRSGLKPDLAQRTIRLSLGRFTSQKDIDLAVKYISKAVMSFSSAS